MSDYTEESCSSKFGFLSETEGGCEEDEDLTYSDAVQEAIEQLMPADDPLYRADFDVTNYINTLFPTEQSLSQLDETMAQVSTQMSDLDSEIAELVQCQSTAGRDGQTALQEAKVTIQDLFTRIREIKAKTDMSESMVKEITRDIKQLDVAKKNLTASITTLHHLHILLSGLESLGGWIQQRQYGEIANSLPAILNVLVLFEPYMAVPQVKDLADQVHQQRRVLSEQVVMDFKDSLGGVGARSRPQILDICRVASVLDPGVKANLTSWYIELQLREYTVLYADTEDIAWLDHIDHRYRWFISKLTEFENSGTSGIFPSDWDMGRKMTLEFCNFTRDMLDKVMKKRIQELDAKLLAHAIQLTAKFEGLLCKRYPQQSKPAEKSKTTEMQEISFHGIIRRVFENYMNVFISAQDKNMNDFLEQCVSRFRDGDDRPKRETSTTAYPLPSSGRIFLFFKRTMVEATEISTHPEQLLAETGLVFKKYLKEYAHRCLTSFLPKINASQIVNTTGLISALLKEGEVPRLSQDEQFLTCCILCTADWCAETTQQLHDKLKEKVSDSAWHSQIDMNPEQDLFYNISSSALTVLVQDLEAACEAALQTMTKISWSTVEGVGDESTYVGSIRNHLKQNIPRLRDFLADRRKYFGHVCLKFATQFQSKFFRYLFRCKPCSLSGAEQLLLDTHALKTFLLNMPSVDSAVLTKPPTAYTKMVLKGMTKAEMLLKVVMSPMDSPESFVDHYLKLLPDSDQSEFLKVLEMKSIRRAEQSTLIQLHRNKTESLNKGSVTGSGPMGSTIRDPSVPLLSLVGETDDSRIKKLERLVKKKL